MMAHIIHARRAGGEFRYRMWSTIVDAYLSPPLTEATMRRWIDDASGDPRDGIDLDARLARARQYGTSAHGRVENVDGEWQTERCDRCGHFHHAFTRRRDGTCSWCGEGESYRGHAPPCGRLARDG